MANVRIQVEAIANFKQLESQLAALKASVAELQSVPIGGPSQMKAVSDRIGTIRQEFERTVLATKAFNIESIKMTDHVDQFATRLAKGQVGLSEAWRVWRQEAKGGSQLMNDLVNRQTRLMKSVFMPDPQMAGYAKMITSTNASVEELGATSEAAAVRMTALNSTMRAISTGMINFGKNTQWAGRQLTVGLTMPLAMFGAAASKAYLDFDKQMTSMLKVYGAHAVVQSQATLDQIEKAVTDLADKTARTMGVAMSDTVEVAKTFSSIGLEGKNLISATEATTRLMKLGDLQANQAAGAMVSLQNVFKLQTNEIQGAVDFLNAAKHSTSTTMQDIIDAIPRVGPIIQQMGGTYKDFVAMLVAMKESGVPAAQGANAIKSMIASIIKPTTQAKKDFKSMGVDLEQLASKNANNVMGMVQGLQQSLDALPKSERLRAIEELFGKFQFARVTALLDNLGKSGSQSAKVLQLYGQSNAQLAAVAKQEIDVASNKTPAAQFQKMKATLQADLIPLGRTFLKDFTAIGNALDKVVGFVGRIGKMLGPVGHILGMLIGGGLTGMVVAGPIIMLVGLFTNLAGQIFKAYTSLSAFRRGFAQGGLLTGIKSMNEMFQQTDKGIEAAKALQDGLTSSVHTTADAYEILNAAIAKMAEQLARIPGMGIGMPAIPVSNQTYSDFRTVNPFYSNASKTTGIVRPHMFAGSSLREAYINMSPEERMKYPNMMAMESQIGPAFSAQGGYLERGGLPAQWTVAPAGIGSVLNNKMNSAEAIYGGKTGVTKEALVEKNMQSLIEEHDKLLMGISKADDIAKAQLVDLFGTESVKLENLTTEQKAKAESYINDVIFSEEEFHTKLADHLAMEQKIYELGIRNSAKVESIISEIKVSMEGEAGQKVGAIRTALMGLDAELNAIDTAIVQRITMEREALMQSMMMMNPEAAALGAAEIQTGISLAADRAGLSAIGATTGQSNQLIRQATAIATTPKFATGGYISGPGGPTDDKIPAMLSGGEYVIKASSVSKYGRGTLDAINNGYATGGAIQYLSNAGPVSRKDTMMRPKFDKLARSLNYSALDQFISLNNMDTFGGWDKSHFFGGNKLFTPGLTTMAPTSYNQLLKQMYGWANSDLVKDYPLVNNVLLRNGQPVSYEEALEFSRFLRDPRLIGQKLLTRGPAGIRTSRPFDPNSPYESDSMSFQQSMLAGGKRAYANKLASMTGIAAHMRRNSLPNPEKIATVSDTIFNLEGAVAELPLFEFAQGGQIPAMLSNGEYVMSPEAVAAHGSSFMDGINSGTAHLASGGGVGFRMGRPSSPMRLSGGGDLLKLLLGESAYNLQFGNRPGEYYGGSNANRGVLRNVESLPATDMLNSQIRYGADKIGTAFTSTKEAVMMKGMQFSDSFKEAGAKISTTMTMFNADLERKRNLAQYAANPSAGAKGLYDYYSTYRGAGYSPAQAKAAAEKLQSEVVAEGGGGSKGFLSGMKGMKGMMGMQMSGMLLDQLGSKMAPGMGQSAVSGLGMGMNMGGMAMMFGATGPVALGIAGAVAGFSLLSKYMDEQRQKAQMLADAQKTATDMTAESIQNLGIKVADFTNVNITAEKAVSKNSSAISAAAQVYANSQDPTIASARQQIQNYAKSGDTTSISNLAKQRYLSDLALGQTKAKSKADALGMIQGSGITGLTLGNISTGLSKLIPKSTGDAFLTATTAAAEATGKSGDYSKLFPRDYYKTMLQYAKAGVQYGDTQASFQSTGSSLYNSTIAMSPQQIASLTGGTQGAGSKGAYGTVMSDVLKTRDAYKAFNDQVKQNDPALAALNNKLHTMHVSTGQIAVATRLAMTGMKMSEADYLKIGQDASFAASMIGKYNAQQAVAGAMGGILSNATAKDASGQNAATTATQNNTKAKQDQIKHLNDYIKVQEAAIKDLNKEIQAEDRRFQQQKQSIQNEQTLADLKAKVSQAAGSGDLFAMAEAQNAYNAAVNDQSAQDAHDRLINNLNDQVEKHQNAIDKTQVKIAKLNDQINNLSTAAANAASTVTTNTNTAAHAAETLQQKMLDAINTGKYATAAEAFKAMMGQKGIGGLLATAGSNSGDLKTALDSLYKQNPNLGPAAAAVEGLQGRLKSAAVQAKMFELILSGDKKYQGAKGAQNAYADALAIINPTGGTGDAQHQNRTSLNGGRNTHVGRANGGPISYFANAGRVLGPGGPTDDMIPAMLSNGEYVIRASSVKRYGPAVLDAINSGTFVPNFATGGIARAYHFAGGSGGGNSSVNTDNSVYNITVNAGAGMDANALANLIMQEIERNSKSLATNRTLGAI